MIIVIMKYKSSKQKNDLPSIFLCYFMTLEISQFYKKNTF